MKLLIKFPTRSRARKFLTVLNKYVKLMEDKTNQIVVSCDNDDPSMLEDYVKDVVSQYDNVTLLYGDNKSKIQAINNDMGDIDFDIVLLASDDMIPQIKGYDTIIKNKMEEFYPDTDGVLWFDDGNRGDGLNTLCILGKKYYDRFGYIYHPEYKSLWCDNEFMDVSKKLNKVKYINQVIIKHEHPDCGYGDRDVIHKENYVNDSHDRDVYNKRKKINFNL